MQPITLKAARQKRRWTQKDLEAAAGVDQSIISRLERGVVTRPEFDTIKKLAIALRVSPLALQFSESTEPV